MYGIFYQLFNPASKVIRDKLLTVARLARDTKTNVGAIYVPSDPVNSSTFRTIFSPYTAHYTPMSVNIANNSAIAWIGGDHPTLAIPVKGQLFHTKMTSHSANGGKAEVFKFDPPLTPAVLEELSK